MFARSISILLKPKGIVPGGGVAPLRASVALQKLKLAERARKRSGRWRSRLH